MGTSYHISLVGTVTDLAALEVEINKLLDAIDQSMSTYIDDSELNLLNNALVAEPFSVSDQLCEVLSIAAEVHSLSGGAFDPTIRPLVDLWGFGPQGSELQQAFTPPKDVVIKQKLRDTGFDHLAIDCEQLVVTKSVALTLDLSAIAKGYAVDKVAELISRTGVENYLVEIGGEVKVAGVNAHQQSWRIAVEKPALLNQQVQRVLNLSNTGLATSGDYRNYYAFEDVRYSHTLDPQTGYPITHNLVSVTVIDTSTAKADALATAFMVLGEKKSMTIAQQQDIAVFFIVKASNDGEDSFQESMTVSFNQLTGEAQ